EMLARADRHGSLSLVAAMAPGLPFTDAVFDVVVANLVLSHLPDLRRGLQDVLRIMHKDARLGCTAWAAPLPTGPGNEGPEADEIVASVRQQCGLEVPPPEHAAVPFEDQLQDRDQLMAVLAQAGLIDLSVELYRYLRTSTVDEFLS